VKGFWKGLGSHEARTALYVLATVVVFVVLFILTLELTSTQHTSRENGLVQFIFLAVGVGGSFVFGRQSAKAAATDVLRPAARAAVRRLANLASGMQAIGSALIVQREYMEEQANDEGLVAVAHVAQAQDMLTIQINAQIRTATDAIEDWREFVPEAVAAVEHQGAADGG
jgi:hypothetical protein